MIVARRLRGFGTAQRLHGLGAASSSTTTTQRRTAIDPTITQQRAIAQEEIQQIFIDTDGEVVDETTSPLDELVETADGYVTQIAPPGGMLRTWGPPLVLGAVIIGAFWWLRK